MRPIMPDEMKTALNATMKTELYRNIIHGVAIDSRADLSDKVFFAIKGKNHDGHDFLNQAIANRAAGLVIQENITISKDILDNGINVFQVKDTVEALGKLARYYRSTMISAVELIAVTGSNGKTTTREMIHHVLSKSFKGSQSPKNYNNYIGAPLSILEIEHDHDFAVIELGTSSPGEINYLSKIVLSDIAVITSIGPSHLEGLKSIEGVSAEKASITSGLKDKGTIICNGIYANALAQFDSKRHKVITFGLDNQYHISATNITPDQRGGISFDTNDKCRIRLAIPGIHNVSNALAALAVCRRLDITTEEFAQAISDFNAVEGRLNIKLINGITVIDDSYNANPASMVAALSVLDYHPGRRRIFCCGDMGELGSQSIELHESLGNDIANSKTDILITAGRLTRNTAEAAIKNGFATDRIYITENSEQAAKQLMEIITVGDIVLTKGSRSTHMEKIVDSIKNRTDIIS